MTELSGIIQVLVAFNIFFLIVVIIVARAANHWKNRYNTLYNTQVNDVWGSRYIYYSTKTQEKWITHRQDISTHIRNFLQQNPDKYGVFTMTIVRISAVDVDVTVDVYDDIEDE